MWGENGSERVSERASRERREKSEQEKEFPKKTNNDDELTPLLFPFQSEFIA